MSKKSHFHRLFRKAKEVCSGSFAEDTSNRLLAVHQVFLLALMRGIFVLLLIFYALLFRANGQARIPFASSPLTEQGDLSVLMVEGIDRFLMLQTTEAKKTREEQWHRDFSSAEAFQRSISAQRQLLATRVGAVEDRAVPELQVLTDTDLKQFKLETERFIVRAVRWKVLDELWAEGLLLQPKGKAVARMVMIPDADMLPEVLAGMQNADGPGFGAAQQLAIAGVQVLIPVLVNRQDSFSGSLSLNLFTNQPHREWIYRQAYEVGRHVVGYELQKIFSAIDWLEARNRSEGADLPIGVAGYGEGGLLALYAAALDERIASTLVSGYFDAREQLWSEPIYRNIFGLLKTFGDAEIAVMSWPRSIAVEYAEAPEISVPPSGGSTLATPGRLTTPDLTSSKNEWERAKSLVPAARNHLQFIEDSKGKALKPFSHVALNAFVKGLKMKLPEKLSASPVKMRDGVWINANRRQQRTVREMERHVQRVLALCSRTRDKDFWATLKGDAAAQQSIKAAQRKRLGEVLGSLPKPSMPANVKARFLQETDKWTSYEVTLNVFPEVFAWGILLIPKDLRPGEKRPVVVCQHGLEGVPMDAVTTDSTAKNFHFYKGFAARLAERGYVTFSPHNPYRGEDKFRVLQRKANPIGLTLFSVITAQHQRIVDWLVGLSFIDPSRIGFYGLSYGGKTAMRVPALVEGYALSICSGDFNEWVVKNATTDYSFSYMFSREYDMAEWDLGHTFNYAEMAVLIAPRPFMVERGHNDGVALDEWVDFEYAKVRRYYASIGLPGSTRIEHFNGPHTIHGVGTFEFLDKFLKNR